MSLDFRSAFPAAARVFDAREDAGEASTLETVIMSGAIALGIVIVALVAVLMGMT